MLRVDSEQQHTDQEEREELPNRYLPLYRSEVRCATGVSAETLAKAIHARPEQFGPGVVQQTHDGETLHVRFNAHRHILFLKEKQKWYGRQDSQRPSCRTVSGRSEPSIIPAKKALTASSQKPVSRFPRTQQDKKPKTRLSDFGMTGADLLTKMLEKSPAE